MPLPTIAFSDFLSLSRAGLGTVRNAAGNRANIGADTRRPDFSVGGVAQGILIEGADTNYFNNPLWVGGSAGVAPTGFAFNNMSAIGLTGTVLGVADYNGDPELQIRLAGTGITGTGAIFLGQGATIAAVAGSVQHFGFNLRMIGGSRANINTLQASMTSLNGVVTTTNLAGSVTGTPLPTIAARASGQGASDVSYTPSMTVTVANGGAVSIDLGISAPFALKSGRPAQSLIRPASGTGASARNRDAIGYARLDWWDIARTAGGLNVGSAAMWEFNIPAAPLSGTQNGLWRLDDGTSSNRMVCYVNSASQVVLDRYIGGSLVSSTTLGTVTPGTPFRVALSATSAGLVAVMTGGDIQTVALGSGTFTPARGYLGTITTDDTTALWGWWRGALCYPASKSNADLLTLVNTAIPFATLAAEGQ